jgi:hypothetical protein
LLDEGATTVFGVVVFGRLKFDPYTANNSFYELAALVELIDGGGDKVFFFLPERSRLLDVVEFKASNF